MANSLITSYVRLFDEHGVDGLVIHRIQIPVIQRDYAQGRNTAKEVRDSFLNSLHMALVKPTVAFLSYGLTHALEQNRQGITPAEKLAEAEKFRVNLGKLMAMRANRGSASANAAGS